MSPTKKKTAKKKSAASGTKKKASAKASPKRGAVKAKAPRKKAAAAKKATPKKTAAAKPAPKKKAGKKPAAAQAKKATELSTPIATEQRAPAPAAKKEGAARAPAVPKKRAPRGKPIPLSTVPHPKFGLKFECFKCQAKFYDLGKPDPICPKCGADQRDRPRVAPKQPSPTPRRLGDRPIVPLLDDEDEVTSQVVSFEEATEVTATPAAVDIFDDEDDAADDDDEIFEVGGDKPISQLIVDDSEEL